METESNSFVRINFFSKKISIGFSCELFAKQTVHMKCHDLFSLNNNKKLECCLLQILLGGLRLKIY